RQVPFAHKSRADLLQSGHRLQIGREMVFRFRQLLLGLLSAGNVNHDGHGSFDSSLRVTDGRNVSVDPYLRIVLAPIAFLEEETLPVLKEAVVQSGVVCPVAGMSNVS